jgi:hypothetical protein
MTWAIILPDPFDPEGDRVVLEEFSTDDEAKEWASELFDIDEEGKISIIVELDECEQEEYKV